MAKRIEEESAKRLAGLQKDLNGKIADNTISIDELFEFINMSDDNRRKIFGVDKVINKHITFRNKLLGQPLLKLEVEIPNNFSLDQNMVPKAEFTYGPITDYARDKYFEPQTISGKAKLTISSTTKDATNSQIVKAAQQTDAIAIIAALHHLLITDPSKLDKFKDRYIIVPVKSMNGYPFCLYLYWDGLSWRWHYYWLDGEWNAGIYVAEVLQ